MYDINKLLIIANKFRSAFEETDLSEAPGFLPGFPEGCCSWASYMIGNYLKYELGLNPIEIQAERDAYDGNDPHSWIVVNDIIIDITSDEFDDSNEKVIVSSNSEWHKGWEVVNEAEIVKINEYDKIDYGKKLKPTDVYNMLTERVRYKCT
jgi:hypothetical protein